MADTITAAELGKSKNDYIIIDVRESDELNSGKIEDSMHLPLGLAIRRIKKGELEDLKNKKICTYCGTGYRGNIAADEFNKAGFSAVTLEGGFGSWNKR